MNTYIIDSILIIIPILLIIYLYKRNKENFLEIYEYDDTINASKEVKADKVRGEKSKLLVTEKVCLSTINKLGQENINCFTENNLSFMKYMPLNLGDKICIGEVCVDKTDFYNLTHYWMPGSITMYYGDKKDILPPWYICDGENGTPDLRDRMLLGTDNPKDIGKTGGEKDHILTKDELPKHSHTFPVYTGKVPEDFYKCKDGRMCSNNNQQGIDFNNKVDAPFNLGNYTTGEKVGDDPCNVNLPFNAFGFHMSSRVKGANGFFLSMNNNAYISNQQSGPVQKSATISTEENKVKGKSHNNIPPYYALYYIMRVNKEDFTNSTTKSKDPCLKNNSCKTCMETKLNESNKKCVWSDLNRKCKSVINDNSLPDSLPFNDAIGMGQRFIADKICRDKIDDTKVLDANYICSLCNSDITTSVTPN